MRTGTLRQDIELIRPGAHGNDPMLFDPLSENYFRIDASTALMISKLDRDCEIDRFVERLNNAGLSVTEAEVIEVLHFLRQNHLLAPEYGEYEAKKRRLEQVRRDTLLPRIASLYVFFKLPPWRPDRFFRRIAPYARVLADRRTVLAALVPAALGYLLMLRDFSAVRSTFLDSISWAGLAKFFAAIVVMKIIHEASHALAAMRFHCRVRAIGLSFIVFYPRIFTDTTDSWRLPRRQRLMIDCAGILGEMIAGGVAALLWCYLPPGVAKSTMFYIFAVGTLSTLLVNGNPLIRYDGYYILCDLLNVENLMGRSAECLKQYWRFWFFGLGSPPREPRRALLAVFGVASFLYRIMLYTLIILVIYHSFVKAAGVVLLLLEVYTLLLRPLCQEIRTIRQMSKRAAARANWCWSVLSLLILLALLFFPLSWNVTLPGMVAPEKSELVTVEETGFLQSEWPPLPVRVEQGEPLFALTRPELRFRIEKFQWSLRLDELLFRLQQLDRETYGASQVTGEKLRSDLIGMEELIRREGNLVRKASHAGLFVPRRSEISPGALFPAGMIAGELVSDGKMVHAYANDREVRKLRVGRRAEILFPDRLGVAAGRVAAIAQIPAKLRHSPLLQNFGGAIPVYSDEKNPGEYTSLQALYRIEIEFDDAPECLAGRSVEVRILHREMLGGEILKLLLSAFRREF